MAAEPEITLNFEGRCPDCAKREVNLPEPLPIIGDDFDWLVRDFDSYRRVMLEELSARFPGRSRWTPADMEVVLVEVLAAILDQLSDMTDRVAAEAFLETARRPESVRRLLALIGYDAAAEAGLQERELERLWWKDPALMDMARRQGPSAVHAQHRMVTVADYGQRLEEHPLVLRAHAWNKWSGSWTTIRVVVILWNNSLLDQKGLEYPTELEDRVSEYHFRKGLPQPVWQEVAEDAPTIRTILQPFLDAYRMLGQEVVLQDVEPVGIKMSLSVRIMANYFQSEVQNAIQEALGTGPAGFFKPGRLEFGEDLFASDIFQTVMSVDGVENICLNQFKRFGWQYPNQADTGRIALEELEIAVCDNIPARPERGYFSLSLHGGQKG